MKNWVMNMHFNPIPILYDLFQGLFRFVALVTKNPLNYFILKVTKFHGNCVKNESARTKNYRGRQTSPPRLFMVNVKICCHSKLLRLWKWAINTFLKLKYSYKSNLLTAILIFLDHSLIFGYHCNDGNFFIKFF